MTLKDDLHSTVKQIFSSTWTERDGQVVPEPEAIKLSNDAVKLEAVVLYADLAESTAMVDAYRANFAAEVYKAYLHCAAKVIASEGGVVTAYDGDRVMAVYIGDSKDGAAARTALKLNYARREIIQPAIQARYPAATFTLNHVVGIDRSSLLVARTGVRGANDLVWVGRAANHAAKMASLSHDFPSVISADVYGRLLDFLKIGKNGQAMWHQATWNGRVIYRSKWYLPF